MKKIIASLALLMTASMTQAGQFDEIIPSAELKSKVDAVLGTNAQSVTYFDSGFDGLTAITLVSKQMKKHTFYTNDKGEFFMAGNLIDGSRQANLTPQFEAKVSIEFPADLTERMSAIPAVVQGKSDDNVVYAVIDANCGYCHRKYSLVEQMFASGEFENVEIRWIPVGFLGQDSQAKAFALGTMIESDPLRAKTFLTQLMKKQRPAVPQDLLIKRDGVMEAEKLMRDYGFGGVPFVLMRNGDNWSMNPGLPRKEFFTQAIVNPDGSEETIVATGNE